VTVGENLELGRYPMARYALVTTWHRLPLGLRWSIHVANDPSRFTPASGDDPLSFHRLAQV
jgi:hypothetical protein